MVHYLMFFKSEQGPFCTGKPVDPASCWPPFSCDSEYWLFGVNMAKSLFKMRKNRSKPLSLKPYCLLDSTRISLRIISTNSCIRWSILLKDDNFDDSFPFSLNMSKSLFKCLLIPLGFHCANKNPYQYKVKHIVKGWQFWWQLPPSLKN